MTDLEAIILTILRDAGPLHGLAVALEAEGRLSKVPAVPSFYRALRRLEESGMVAARWESETEAKSHQGPVRRIYRLQAAGGHALAAFASEREHFVSNLQSRKAT